jgi:hypothetical protein
MAVGALGQARALRTQTSFLLSAIREFREAYRRVQGQNLPERVFEHYRDVFSRDVNIRTLVRSSIYVALFTPNQRAQMRPYETRLIEGIEAVGRELATAIRIVNSPPIGTSRSDFEELRAAATDAARAHIRAQTLYYDYSDSDTYWSTAPYRNLQRAFEGGMGVDFAAGLPAGWAPTAKETESRDTPPREEPHPALIIGGGIAFGLLAIGVWSRLKGR